MATGNPEMNALLEELETALNAFRAEASFTDWNNHPRLLDAIRAKDKLVAMSKGDYKSLWEIEKRAHQETQERAEAEGNAMRAKLVRVSCAYLKKLGALAKPPASSSCPKCRLPPACCGCSETARLLWHLVGTTSMERNVSAVAAAGAAAVAGAVAGAGAEAETTSALALTPALPSSPPPESGDEDLYS